eukprot:s687_g4.t1
MAAQLAWLRMYPKVRTPCCGAAVCFKCKVRGWHKHVTCEDGQRQETGRNAQYCPNCQVPTTRSDGCTHIRCVCGSEWTWQERDDGSAADMGPDDDDGEDDESDRSSEVIKTIATAPVQHRTFGHNEIPELRRANRFVADPVLPADYAQNADKYPRCRAGHPLVAWGASRTATWVCDGCEDLPESHRCKTTSSMHQIFLPATC